MFTIIGSKGNLGSLLMKIFPGSSGIDRDNVESTQKYLSKSDYAFLAVPLNEEKKIISENTAFNGFIDLSSVKSEVTEYKNKLISIHPLFGPLSYGKIKDIIFINDISYSGSFDIVKQLFPGYNIIEMTADEHDKLIAEIMVKPYIFSYISTANSSNIRTNSYNKYLEIYNIKKEENPDIFLNTVVLNKYTSDIINEISGNLEGLKRLIKDRGRG